MKVLVICNNHNSINILKLCIKLKTFLNNLKIVAIFSSSKLANDFYSKIYSKIDHEKDIYYKIISSQGIKSINFSNSINENSNTENLNKDIISKAREWLSDVISYLSKNVFLYKFRELIISSRLKRYKTICYEYLYEEKFSLVMSMSDRTHDYLESSMLYEAKNIGLKIILPYLAQYDLKAPLSYRLDKFGKIKNEFRPFHPPTLYKIISFFKFRDQLNDGYFFQSPYILNAHRRNKTISDYPWWPGNGNSDIVCVDSDHTAKQYIENRVPASKIRIVGHSQLDEVFLSLKNKSTIKDTLIKKYNLNAEKKFYILSLPQHAEQGYLKWEEHISQIEKIIKIIKKRDCNFLVSIHPRQDKLKYLYLEDKYDCNFIDEPLSNIIGISDIFLSSNSSTAIWATLCGIPVLNIKGPTANLFPYLDTVFYASSINEIDSLITSISKNKTVDFSSDWIKLSRDNIFDGNFSKRFIDLITQHQ